MITQEVISEIYKSYNKPCKNEDDLNLPYFVELLRPHHRLTVDDMEVIVESEEEFSPFRRFLKRGLYAVLEFDRKRSIRVSVSYSFLQQERQQYVGAFPTRRKETALAS